MSILPNFLKSKIKNFKNNSKGAAAVEFAIIMMPFLLILVGTLQMTVLYFTKVILDTGMQGSVVMFKNYHNTQREVNIDIIRTTLCDKKYIIISCAPDNLKIDVTRLKDFTSGTKPINDGNDEGLYYQFDEIIVVRALYQFQMNFPVNSKELLTLTSFAIVPPPKT